ncbi:MAG: ribonuclease P protein component [Bdellovibrionales bacterium]|nr:ribonuclease P protein component [Bdellovibrionales bacterium]
MRPSKFRPESRLHFPWEYRRFFGSAEILRLPEILIFRIPNQAGHPRLGMTVKASSGAIERNRVKRMIREFFRKHQESLGSFDYNFVVPGAKRIDFQFRRRLGSCLSEKLAKRIETERVFENAESKKSRKPSP